MICRVLLNLWGWKWKSVKKYLREVETDEKREKNDR